MRRILGWWSLFSRNRDLVPACEMTLLGVKGRLKWRLGPVSGASEQKRYFGDSVSEQKRKEAIGRLRQKGGQTQRTGPREPAGTGKSRAFRWHTAGGRLRTFQDGTVCDSARSPWASGFADGAVTAGLLCNVTVTWSPSRLAQGLERVSHVHTSHAVPRALCGDDSVCVSVCEGWGVCGRGRNTFRGKLTRPQLSSSSPCPGCVTVSN